jgi:hypothetical protein
MKDTIDTGYNNATTDDLDKNGCDVGNPDNGDNGNPYDDGYDNDVNDNALSDDVDNNDGNPLDNNDGNPVDNNVDDGKTAGDDELPEDIDLSYDDKEPPNEDNG